MRGSFTSYESTTTNSFKADVARIHSLGYRANGVAVGCLDTGIDSEHPALRGRIAGFRRFQPSGRAWEDGTPGDSSWHGTHVAGLIAGDDPAAGVVGPAPGARLFCGAVIEEGAILARVLLGLDWLAGCGIAVANLSLGIPGASPVFRTMLGVLAEQDVLITAPIGNRGAGHAFTPGIDPAVLSVGATDDSGRVAKFSGSLNDPVTKLCEKPDLVAPATGLRSSVPNGGFEARSGTSMASAIVAGMAALLRGAFPQASAAAVSHALCSTSLPLALDQNHRARNGLVRLGKAFEALRTAPKTPPPAPREPFARYIDKRLATRLSYVLDTTDQDAILEFADHDESRSFAAEFARRTPPGRADAHWLLALHHAPICIVRCPVPLLKQALNSRSLRVASSCDVDRSHYFKAIF